ncbi:MAG: c-type cytochrome [Gammaproteobacteria bacterium]|nr:c-type cytochrome [Gammaproteobacteria bacterium]
MCKTLLYSYLSALALFLPLAHADSHMQLSEDGLRFADGNAIHGAPLYKRYCRGCHGKDGRGGGHTFMPHVHKLTQKDYINNIPDTFLFLVISKGGEAVGKSSYMPAWETVLSPSDIKHVIAYIRSLPTY